MCPVVSTCIHLVYNCHTYIDKSYSVQSWKIKNPLAHRFRTYSLSCMVTLLLYFVLDCTKTHAQTHCSAVLNID